MHLGFFFLVTNSEIELNKLKTLKVGQEFKIRNHWLHFEKNGKTILDLFHQITNGFNDRPGIEILLISFLFKNLELIPMIVMDGHF